MGNCARVSEPIVQLPGLVRQVFAGAMAACRAPRPADKLAGMAKRLEHAKPSVVALAALLNGGGLLLFWWLLDPEMAAAGGTIAVIAFGAFGLLFFLVFLATQKSAPPNDQPPDSN